jgi:Transposase, Mutator family
VWALPRRVGEELEQASPDLLRAMVKTFAEADAICGAPYGQPSEDRVNYRNGYRDRRWDTRAGTIELAIPRLRQGSYFPDWLLERRRRSEQALISVVATSYLLGVPGPAGGEAGRDARHQEPVQEPGVRPVQEPGCRGGAVPVPAAGRRPVPDHDSAAVARGTAPGR